jgi:hypothetical protein
MHDPACLDSRVCWPQSGSGAPHADCWCLRCWFRGYMILPDVFEPSTCAGFRRRVVAAAAAAASQQQPQPQGTRVWRLPPESPELVEPIAAPRIRSMLAGALSVGLSVLPADWANQNPTSHSAVVTRPSRAEHETAEDGGGGGVERLHRPFVQVVDTSWLIDDSSKPGVWHRDRWVEGEEGGGALSGLAVNGAASGGYSPPEVVHLAML